MISDISIRSCQQRRNFEKLMWVYIFIFILGLTFVILPIHHIQLVTGTSLSRLGLFNILFSVLMCILWIVTFKAVKDERLGMHYCLIMTFIPFWYLLFEDVYIIACSGLESSLFAFACFDLICLLFIALFDMPAVLTCVTAFIALLVLCLYVSFSFSDNLQLSLVTLFYSIVTVLIAFVLDKTSCDSLRNLHSLIQTNQNMHKSMEATIDEMHEKDVQLKMIQHETVIGLANLIEYRSGETGCHVKNTQTYMELLVSSMMKRSLYPEELTDSYADLCITVACLHDIGKITVPDYILNAPRKLTDEEFSIMKTHTVAGALAIDNILGSLEDTDYLNVAKQVALSHHERWDGRGYPNQLKGYEIPLCARLMSVVDVFDALVSERCYKKAYSVSEALNILRSGSGTQFDPLIVNIFIEIIELQNCA